MPAKSGIYKITVRGLLYVGSAVDIPKRWRSHRSTLRNKTHHSQRMQRIHDKYGIEEFQFDVLEYIDDPNGVESNGNTKLINAEQLWLDTLFSIRPKETILNHLRIARIPDDETKEKLRNRNKGKSPPKRVLEQQRAYWISNSIPFDVVSPNGKIYTVYLVREFAREHNLISNALSSLRNGKIKQHKGWTLVNTVIEKQLFSFISPDGVIYENIEHLTNFCDEHDISQSQMSSVWNEKIKQCKGWRKYPLVNFPEKPKKPRNKGYTLRPKTDKEKDQQRLTKYKKHNTAYAFLDPSGNVHTDIISIRQFATDNNLDPCSLYSVWNGTYKHHKGWVKYAI